MANNEDIFRVTLVVKELGFLNVRSVEALDMAQNVPLDGDQHTLPYFDQNVCTYTIQYNTDIEMFCHAMNMNACS
jgi:hypothetical protein